MASDGITDWLLSNPKSLTDSGGTYNTSGIDMNLSNLLSKYVYNPTTNDVNWAGVGTGLMGLYSLFGGGSDVKTAGWSKPPPKLAATFNQVPVDNTNRRPGEAGRRYFTDVQFTPQDSASVQAAQQASQAQAQSMAAAQPTYQPKPNPYAGTFRTPWEQPTPAPTQAMAQGGQVPEFGGTLQSGGFVVPGDVVRHADPAGQANKERGLAALHQSLGAQAIRGPGDAMSDSIPTSIDGRQPAAVANGEAYVPPQQVQKAGGAQRLYDMMEKLRLERTGSKKQINPDNPKELQRAYSQGGLARFNGETGSAVTGTSSGTPTSPDTTGYGSSTLNTLSPYVGEYVTNALGQAAAMAATPYQAYTGPLTAGPSDLQQQAFAGMSQIAQTGFTPETYGYQTGQFTGDTAAQYMNPYLSAALTPQMQEMQRQADIARLADSARLTQAGAYGGSRQAIMESEGRRNLLDAQSKALGEGYMSAYDRALQQYNLEQGKRLEAQNMGEKSRQYSAEFGLRSLGDLASLGATQRDIDAQGIAADKAQFEEERQYAYARPGYQLGMLDGLPIGGNTTTQNTTGISQLQSQIKDLGGIYGSIAGLFK